MGAVRRRVVAFATASLLAFYLYVILYVFSRYAVGCMFSTAARPNSQMTLIAQAASSSKSAATG